MKLRKKPVIVDGVIWDKDGDHPKVSRYTEIMVRVTGICPECHNEFVIRGFVPTLQGKERKEI